LEQRVNASHVIWRSLLLDWKVRCELDECLKHWWPRVSADEGIWKDFGDKQCLNVQLASLINRKCDSNGESSIPLCYSNCILRRSTEAGITICFAELFFVCRPPDRSNCDEIREIANIFPMCSNSHSTDANPVCQDILESSDTIEIHALSSSQADSLLWQTIWKSWTSQNHAPISWIVDMG
jgi:hypothetical protein